MQSIVTRLTRTIRADRIGFSIAAISAIATAAQAELPGKLGSLRQAGPLDITLRTNTARDVTLHLDAQYPTQSFGVQLTTEQMDKIELIRSEAPEKFEMLQSLFPRQIAEYLVRTNSSWPPAGGAPVKIESAMPRRENASFDSPEKARVIAALQKQYSPYRPVTMSLTGNVLSLNGRIVTERLGSEARSAGRSREDLAHERYQSLAQEFARWRDGQISGNAYAGSIKAFLRDPRLATFTPDEVRHAYQQVFGRDLQIDLEADRLAREAGHPLTYNELASRKK